MLGLIQRAASKARNPTTSVSWSPDTDLPAGFSSRKSSYTLPISSLASLSFRAIGHFSRGTVVFQRAIGGDPPAYGDSGREKRRVQGLVQIEVEARYNSEGLYDDCKLDPVEGHERAGLSLTSPASGTVARIGAHVSFHITFTLPSHLDSLDTISVEASHFRILLDQSVAAVDIANLELTTTDAPIHLARVQAQSVRIHNANVLDPNKGALKNFEDLVSGELDADRIEIECAHGAISGTYRSEGALVVHTTNANITGEFSGSVLRLGTSVANVAGSFVAKRDLVIETSNGKVEGEFVAASGCVIKGDKCTVSGRFEVGKELQINTNVFPIDAQIRLLPTTFPSDEPPQSPSPSLFSNSTPDAPPPTFEDALRTRTSPSPSGGGGEGEGKITVVAETTEAHVHLSYLEPHPPGVALSSFARSTGGAKVAVRHPTGFAGTFSASTTINHTAHVETPARGADPSSGGGGGGGGRARAVRYDVQKRNVVAGTISGAGGVEGEVGRSRTVVEAQGPAEIVFVL
ncbi:hypothetical protein JCM1840_005311 [Sporobolomyces johnsonii]